MKKTNSKSNFVVKRLKFSGPANPMDIPEPLEEGGEPPAIDEERKAAEFKYYIDFATEQKDQIEELSDRLCEYNFYQRKAEKNLEQLWPMPPDPEAEERRRQLMELRASQQAEREKKEEEEKKAAEAAAKGKKASNKGARPVGSALSKENTEDDQGNEENNLGELDDPVIKSRDDDPKRQYGFLQFKKVVSEMPLNNCSVGSILGAMVYQIGLDNNKLIKDSLKLDLSNKNSAANSRLMNKKVSSRLLRKMATQEAIRISADEAEMNEVFADVKKDLLHHHAIVETDFKHEFDP